MRALIIAPLGASLRQIGLVFPCVFSLLFLVTPFASSHGLPLEALRLPRVQDICLCGTDEPDGSLLISDDHGTLFTD